MTPSPELPLSLFIEPVTRTNGSQTIVDTHARYKGQKYPLPETQSFPDPESANRWITQMLRDGARWVRLDFRSGPMLPKAYHDIKAWMEPNGFHLQIEGQTVAAGVTDPRELKRLILEHPQGHLLDVRECSRCGRKPRLNLAENTLRHVHDDCPMQIAIEHPAVPIGMKMAAWNVHFAERKHELSLVPVTLPQLEEIGVIRPPTQRELTRRIQKVEIL